MPCYLVDEELALKLESELNLEKDMDAHEEVPESVQDFLGNSPFKVLPLHPPPKILPYSCMC
jgi:hypothetical protein